MQTPYRVGTGAYAGRAHPTNIYCGPARLRN